MKKRTAFFVLIISILMLVSGCQVHPPKEPIQSTEQENSSTPEATENQTEIESSITPTPLEEQEDEVSYISSDGTTLESRIQPPEGFERVNCTEKSFGAFLRKYPMKEDGAPVLLYNGSQKGNQKDHIAVFDMSLSNRDLQQCADSVIRIYAEYFYKTKQFNHIKFHFVNGFLCDYSKWRQGYRIKVNGNQVSWKKTSGKSDSKESFERYLSTVFCYASTLSLAKESKTIETQDLQIGDIFINPGSPGHVVMVVDLCEKEDGEKAFLLAQGYMPAQEFHILRNGKGEENPWYYSSEITYPFRTPEYTFQEGSLMRVMYGQ